MRSPALRFMSSNKKTTKRGPVESGCGAAVALLVAGFGLAELTGAFPLARLITMNPAMVCGLPSSNTSKSSLVRSPTACPWELRATTGTITSLTYAFTNGGEFGSCGCWAGKQEGRNAASEKQKIKGRSLRLKHIGLKISLSDRVEANL